MAFSLKIWDVVDMVILIDERILNNNKRTECFLQEIAWYGIGWAGIGLDRIGWCGHNIFPTKEEASF